MFDKRIYIYKFTVKVHQIRINGSGVQLFTLTDKTSVYVNVYNNGNYMDLFKTRGNKLCYIDFEVNTCEEVFNPSHCFAFSMSCGNNFLVRDCGDVFDNKGVNTRDVILENDFCISEHLDLGYYDSVNSYLRIDGHNYLYFLQGTQINIKVSGFVE